MWEGGGKDGEREGEAIISNNKKRERGEEGRETKGGIERER